MPETPAPDHSPEDGPCVEQVWDVDQEWLDAAAADSLAAELADLLAPPPFLESDVPEFVDDDRFGDEVRLEMLGPVSEWDLVGLSSML